MHYSLLIVPYCVKLLLKGIRLYLLRAVLAWEETDCRDASPMKRFNVLNINWSRWMARDVKAWVIFGILGSVSLTFVKAQETWLAPGLLIFLNLALLADAAVSVPLWFFAAGFPVPGRLTYWAVSMAMPGYAPAGPGRVVWWSSAFILAAAAGLAGWILSGDLLSLLWSFITLTMGFFSLIRWFCGETGETSFSGQK